MMIGVQKLWRPLLSSSWKGLEVDVTTCTGGRGLNGVICRLRYFDSVNGISLLQSRQQCGVDNRVFFRREEKESEKLISEACSNIACRCDTILVDFSLTK